MDINKLSKEMFMLAAYEVIHQGGYGDINAICRQYNISRYEYHKLWMRATDGSGISDYDKWFLCNQLLNTARKAVGKPLRPWTENPYLGVIYNGVSKKNRMVKKK